jgi:very-short-patch-repair endonuclease
MNTSRDQIISRKSLLAFGMTHHAIARAVKRGEFMRIRRGWYASASAPPEAVRAVRIGGVATSLSATRLLGLWTPLDKTLHVALPTHASRLRVPSSQTSPGQGDNKGQARPGICLHWRDHDQLPRAGVASVTDALVDAVKCLPEEQAVVVIDSALNKGLTTGHELESAFARMPRRYMRALGRADGRSESGTETLVRLRLRARGIRVSIQVRILGVGRVDLVVGDRLVIECDSVAFHSGRERYAADRRRDLKLLHLGYLPTRLTYEMVMFDWPATEQMILDIVARRQHLWPRRTRRSTGKTALPRAKTHETDGLS